MAENELTLEELTKRIYRGAGDMGNVESIVHYMTRVRMKTINDDLVSVSELKAIPGVLGIVEDEQPQVIIGPGKVNKVTQQVVNLAGVKLGEELSSVNAATADSSASGKDRMNEQAQRMKTTQESEQEPSRIKSVLKDVSNIFVPVILAFAGTGIVAGVAAVLANLITTGTPDAATWQQYIDMTSILRSGMFSYLVIYTGTNAARVFDAIPTLGGVTGAVAMLAGTNPEAPLKNLFTSEALAAGRGGILGVIFAVWLLSIAKKELHEVVPDAVDIIITPTLSLIVISLIKIFFIVPLADFISDGVVGGINWVPGVGGTLASFVLNTLFLPMVTFKLHQILTPIHVQMIGGTGRALLLSILAMVGAGQVGATLALWICYKKDKELTEMIRGALPVGILGIDEPSTYRVTLPLGRPFIATRIDGSIGRAVIGMIGNVGAIAIGPSGAALTPLISDGKWLDCIFGLLTAYVGGFVATFFFGIPKDRLEKEESAAKTAAVNEVPEKVIPQTSAESVAILSSVTDGTVVSLDKASNPVFAQKMVDEGYFVEPENGHIYSPVTGVISSVFPTKHAIGITMPDGLEILLHMGINTVGLGGTPFDVKVTEGQQVTPDTLVVEADLEAIKAANKETSMIVLVTNMDRVKDFVSEETGKAKAKAPVMDVKA